MDRAMPVVLLLLACACGGGGGDDMPDTGPGDASAAECTTDSDCTGSLVCQAGACVREGCTLGSEGCACGAGDRCARGSDGATLACVDGVCSSGSCPAGRSGCLCIDGETCEAGSACEGGYCMSDTCEDGTEGCACVAGTCDVGLFCLDGALCVDNQGYEGGPCLPNAKCHRGQLCDAALDLCVHCELGSEGCGCDDAGTCNGGLVCAAGQCTDAAALPPTDPVCYTPCEEDLVPATGDVRVCESSGLMRGCVGGLECIEGSCLPPGSPKPTCGGDLDCPFFQTCLAGGCYSNCEDHVDCPSGLSCHQKVCRVPCESTVGAEKCPTGQFCDAPDGANGYCLSLGDASGAAPITVPGGGFALTAESLAFSNVTPSRAVEIQAIDPDGLRHSFTVRRLWHELTFPDGRTEEVRREDDPDTGEPEACTGTACPLWWLELDTPEAAPSRDPDVTIRAFGGCAETEPATCPELIVSNAAGVEATRWRGELEIEGNGGKTTISVTYVARPEGQWVGTMHYFGSFDDGGFYADEPADPPGWLEGGDISLVSNGLIQKWAVFRDEGFTPPFCAAAACPGGWDEWLAVLRSTASESWNTDEVMTRCRAIGGPNGACYPFTNSAGLRTFVTDRAANPIPRGVTELPFVMNLRQPGLSAASLVGRVDSAGSLHYPGDPLVELTLAGDPSNDESCDPDIKAATGGDCVIFLDSLTVESTIGGRFRSTTGTCPAGFEAQAVPFLVDGFAPFRDFDPALDARQQVWCLDTQLPFDPSAGGSPAATARLEADNKSLAWANPVPDGAARRRTLRMLDGALVNQNQLFFFFQETFGGFVDADGSDGVSAYGYVVLKRQAADLDPADANRNTIPDAFEGNAAQDVCTTSPCDAGTVNRTAQVGGAVCDPGLLEDIVGVGSLAAVAAMPNAVVRQLTQVLVAGTAAASTTIIPQGEIHYFCEDTGIFNGGVVDPAAPGAVSIPCPIGSNVVFFQTVPTIDRARVASESCNKAVVCEAAGVGADGEDLGVTCTGGTCRETLNRWRQNGLIQTYEPFYQCNDANAVYCDDDRYDLREGKTFKTQLAYAGRSFRGLHADIDAAFRYRTRFQSSTGSRVGFAPRICIPDSDQIPYCYDPPTVEEIRDRIDCLVAIYSNRALFGKLVASPPPSTTVPPAPCSEQAPCYNTQSELQRFLRGSFAQFADLGGTRDGFERLYAELLVMQGDEALTQAFASRFDLAGVNGAGFEGSLLEPPDGIDLSGVAGFEMVNLYKAVQLYQTALDRLYMLGPNMSVALSQNVSVDSETVFLSAETVVLYLERLIRASTQKTRAYSEIAIRYQNFNQPQLARTVLERAYTAAYLEAAIIQQLMGSIADRADAPDRPQIQLVITEAQRRYRMALLDMRDLYGSITDDVNFFGFTPDYIPFPALDASTGGRNAFDILLEIAQVKTSFARVREQEALASNRSFQTDAATFQAELVRLRNTYENQLADMCGTFESPVDGRVYPAIGKYSSRHPWAQILNEPCGRMGNGAIHRAIVEYQDSVIAIREVHTRVENLIEEIQIERAAVSAQCGRIVRLADFQYRQAGLVRNLESDITITRANLQAQNGTLAAAADMATSLICVPPVTIIGVAPVVDVSVCLNQGIDAGIRNLAALDTLARTKTSEERVAAKEREIADIQADTMKWQTLQECDFAQIDSRARVRTLLLGMRELELELIAAEWESQLAKTEIGRLFNEAARLEDVQEETEGLLIDVEAARNDPNVRVYRNDAIINADISFEDAIRAAYRATKVFEYYTSQTYPRQEQLFLIRMIGAGEFNLENYLLDLENAFFEFEETFGAPDTRVLRLSLMDDILRIPNLGETGEPLSTSERNALLRERVQDADLLDHNGYITMGFPTTLDRLSPLTRNHKILYVEAEIDAVGGDEVARLYLRQAGTGVVQGLDDELDFFVFPERTAVLNPFFGGNRVFLRDGSALVNIYQNYRFRDRPLVNTNWELVFNRRDEVENQDVRLDTLSNIYLYIYYSDFTAL